MQRKPIHPVARLLATRLLPSVAVVIIACAPSLRNRGKHQAHAGSGGDVPCDVTNTTGIDAAVPDAMPDADTPRDERSAEPAAAKAEPLHKRYTLPKGCAPPRRAFDCNPVTNEGCNSEDGEACDDNERGGFKCYPPPNDVDEGGACDDNVGPSCAGGMACDTGSENKSKGVCRKLCCGDADCTDGLHCRAIDRSFGKLGFCQR